MLNTGSAEIINLCRILAISAWYDDPTQFIDIASQNEHVLNYNSDKLSDIDFIRSLSVMVTYRSNSAAIITWLLSDVKRRCFNDFVFRELWSIIIRESIRCESVDKLRAAISFIPPNSECEQSRETYGALLNQSIPRSHIGIVDLERLDCAFALINAGARIEWTAISDALMVIAPVVEYQRVLQVKKNNCQAACAILLSRTHRLGMPRDVSRYLCRRYLWPQRTSDEWITEGAAQAAETQKKRRV
jgi:hypothetical protein